VSEADHFVCPNGHRVDRIRSINCPEPGCRASVVYEPSAYGMALRVRAERAEAELARLRESRDAWRLQAMREHDEGSPE
jgi:hypothetical protein